MSRLSLDFASAQRVLAGPKPYLGVGLLLALAAFPVLIIATLRRGDATEIVGATVFGITVVLLYSTSMLFHAFPQSRAKRIFQVLDHSAIYLLIAGTYTPFTLGVLRGEWGWILFGLVWSMAVVGIVLKALGGIRYNTVSTLVYIAMGWLVVIAADTVWTLVPKWGIFWLFAGGVAYTWARVFLAERIRSFTSCGTCSSGGTGSTLSRPLVLRLTGDPDLQRCRRLPWRRCSRGERMRLFSGLLPWPAGNLVHRLPQTRVLGTRG